MPVATTFALATGITLAVSMSLHKERKPSTSTSPVYSSAPAVSSILPRSAPPPSQVSSSTTMAPSSSARRRSALSSSERRRPFLILSLHEEAHALRPTTTTTYEPDNIKKPSEGLATVDISFPWSTSSATSSSSSASPLASTPQPTQSRPTPIRPAAPDRRPSLSSSLLSNSSSDSSCSSSFLRTPELPSLNLTFDDDATFGRSVDDDDDVVASWALEMDGCGARGCRMSRPEQESRGPSEICFCRAREAEPDEAKRERVRASRRDSLSRKEEVSLDRPGRGRTRRRADTAW